MKTEAAVIGGGPAGLIAAHTISTKGVSVEVFEEHDKIGYPVHCAGIISVEGFERLGLEPEPSFHQNTVYGGKVFSPDGSCITIRDKKPRAYIIDRGEFDSHLAERALDSGVNINKGMRVEEILFKERLATGLYVDSAYIDSRIVIDAEGALGRVLANSGIDTMQSGVINGFNVEMSVDSIESDMVEVWFDSDIARDFFAWVIPIDENRVRCGLGSSKLDGAESLIKFAEKRFGKKPDNIIHGGLMCTGGPVDKTTYPGLMLVGDVAGQVKPTTAGGVVIGGLCAQIAGNRAVTALENDSVDFLDGYEVDWRGRFGSELQTMLFLRNLLKRMNDKRINRMFHAFIEEGLESKFTELVEQGDMDMQEGVIRKAIRDPKIMGAMTKTAGRMALSEFLDLLRF